MRLIDLFRRCGLARPSLATSVHYQQNPTFWFRGDAHLTDPANVEAGDQAQLLVDLSGNGHHAEQATDAKQGTLGTDADGNAEVAVDGAADCYAAELGAAHTGTSHSFWFAIDQDSSTGTLDLLLGVATGPLRIAALGNTANKVSVYDGTWRPIANAAAGEQDLEFHLNDTANTISAIRTGKWLGQKTYGASIALGGNVALGSANTQATSFFDGAYQEAWGRDSLMSNAEIFASRVQRATDYPTRWADTLPLVVPHGSGGCWLNTKSAANFVLSGTKIIVAKDCAKDQDDPVVNGTFATDTIWTKGTNWTIPTPTASAAGATAAQYLQQAILTSGQRGLLRADVTVAANSMTPYANGVAGTAVSASASIAQVLTPDGTALKFGGHAAGFTGTIDNVTWTPGLHAYQPTAANRPTYDAVNKCMNFVAANSEELRTGIDPAAAGITLAMWVRCTDLLANYTLIGSYDGVKNTRLQTMMSGNFRAQVDSGAGNFSVLSSTGIVAGTWYFVAAVITPTEVRLYVNDAAPDTSGGITGVLSTSEMYLGAFNNNGAAANHTNGDISDPHYLPYAADAAMIAKWYAQGRNP